MHPNHQTQSMHMQKSCSASICTTASLDPIWINNTMGGRGMHSALLAIPDGDFLTASVILQVAPLKCVCFVAFVCFELAITLGSR